MRVIVVFLISLVACVLLTTSTANASQGEEANQGDAALEPNHTYVLCINGYSDHSSNDLLLRIGDVWRPTGEGYVDYASVRADGDGKIAPSLYKSLPKGVYKVKLLVKDPANDWQVVWNKDEIEFTVK